AIPFRPAWENRGLSPSACYAFRFYHPFKRREKQMTFSRRDFLSSAAIGAVSLGLDAQESNRQNFSAPAKRPIIVSAFNGLDYLDDAFKFVQSGGDTLDAALKVVKGPEDDPNEDSVGLGGLPNEEGVVELDSCCMHGPSRRAGSVGGVRNIKNVSLVAQ